MVEKLGREKKKQKKKKKKKHMSTNTGVHYTKSVNYSAIILLITAKLSLVKMQYTNLLNFNVYDRPDPWGRERGVGEVGIWSKS